MDVYSKLLDDIKNIDVDNIKNFEEGTKILEIEKPKEYFWIRLLLSDDSNIELNPDDRLKITWLLSNESLECIFLSYGKKNISKDYDGITEYDSEFDTNQLILMIDSNHMERNDIPFLRTIFKSSKYFEFQAFNRNNLKIETLKDSIGLNYVDIEL
jgi:hypothetical protein